MSRYDLLVSLHVASAIVWVGCGTALVFLTIYAQRARNGVVLGQLSAVVEWMTLRVLVPASLAAPAFGVAAAHVGHWPDIFWFHVGEGAFVFSFLLTIAIRLPLLRRARRGAFDSARLSQYLLALALAELTVLYLAVADMVTKPSGIGTNAVKYGGGVLALGLVAAAVIAYRAHKLESRSDQPGAGSPAPTRTLEALTPDSHPIRAAAGEVQHLHQLE